MGAEFVMPVVQMFCGIVSVFVDSKKPGNRWIAILILLTIAGLTLGFNVKSARAKERASAEQAAALAAKDAENKQQNAQIVQMLSTLMQQFGSSPEAARTASTATLQRSLDADRERRQLLVGLKGATGQPLTIQYFPKDVDGNVVKAALTELNARVEIKVALRPEPTNAIWVGDEVTVDEAKAIALTLVRAGAGIKAVRRFRVAGGAKSRLVQIGADSRILRQPDLTVNDIASMASLGRDVD